MLKLNPTFLLPLAVAFLDSANKAVPPSDIDGSPSWTIDRPDLATLQVAEDGYSAEVVPIAEGQVTVTASADALLGDGIKTVYASLTVLIADEADHAVITAGEPVPKPAANAVSANADAATAATGAG